MTKSKSPWDDEIVLVNAVDQGNGANSGDAIVDAAAPAVAANLSSNPIAEEKVLEFNCFIVLKVSNIA